MGELNTLLTSLGIEHLGLFVAAGILLNLTPGPDVLYILAQGAKRGARAGSAAALGIVAGCCVHITAAALGVSALIAASSAAFTGLKWLGAAYLAYVGWGMLRAKKATTSIAASQDDTRDTGQFDLKTIFINGFWTNVLNPKVALFFLAFVPQFIAHDAPHQTLAFLLLGLVFNLNSLWINLGYGWLGASMGVAFAGAQSPRWVWVRRRLHWLERAAGTLFLAFGLKLALMDNPAN
ncbi:LysE family translocator [Rhodoferax sp.]|uniref:LysE family translocator n=1 Tax=Rhodoferax sp. TaxID=50421 RepID=UPI00283C5008|nr:LysE family translocator [Rhodoferax sp.]MDR3368105.1 LysE family translocator [Rhodoferax sp.]